MTKQVIKHIHHPERELTYSVVLAYMLALMVLRAKHFKFHDRIKHRPIGFQSATLGIA
jgi:predicted transcriptional regulator